MTLSSLLDQNSSRVWIIQNHNHHYIEKKITQTLENYYKHTLSVYDPNILIFKPETFPVSVELIRDFCETLRYQPGKNDLKTVVIYHADKLTHQAYNALLKTLEEPGTQTKIFLAVESLKNIPKTILSRCAKHLLGYENSEISSEKKNNKNFSDIENILTEKQDHKILWEKSKVFSDTWEEFTKNLQERLEQKLLESLLDSSQRNAKALSKAQNIITTMIEQTEKSYLDKRYMTHRILLALQYSLHQT